jgi:hypothetical protein
VAARARLERGVEELMSAARDAGLLRSDIAYGDLMVAVTQLTRPVSGTGCLDIDAFMHRHLQLFLDGLMAPARSELPGAAVTLEDLRRDSRTGCRMSHAGSRTPHATSRTSQPEPEPHSL